MENRKLRKRRINKGLRKVCECNRKTWSKCPHPWHFNFKWNGVDHRFSLDKHFKERIDSKSEAEDRAADLRKAIKAGTFGQAAPREAMTLQQLVDTYMERYVDIEHAATKPDYLSKLTIVCQTDVPHATGGTAALGTWRLTDIVTDSIERFREIRRAASVGVVGVNRQLAALRAVFNWGIRLGYCERTPFKRQTETVVKLSRELPRSRRLDGDEEVRLLQHADAHLHAVIVAALETGMRKGEILSLQWHQVEGLQVEEQADGSFAMTWASKAVIFLPAGKTKTKRDRRVPINMRLRAVLEMRRLDPDSQLLPADAYVFGNAIGQRVGSVSRAWHRAILKAHGHTPEYTDTANFTPETRAALRAAGLHFHDLRREAGSRWMDAGVPLATIQKWLGHTNISQTSTYLAGTAATEHAAMERFEAARTLCNPLATDSKTGGESQPQTAATIDSEPNETAVGHDLPIM